MILGWSFTGEGIEDVAFLGENFDSVSRAFTIGGRVVEIMDAIKFSIFFLGFWDKKLNVRSDTQQWILSSKVYKRRYTLTTPQQRE